METQILRIYEPSPSGLVPLRGSGSVENWEVPKWSDQDFAAIKEAAEQLRNNDIPVAFPTETVYGLGADATRSAAVKGIYAAKGRPSDNPLIVHVSDLAMLRRLLVPKTEATTAINGHNGAHMPNGTQLNGQPNQNGAHNAADNDPIPPVYRPLIARFWPGPLTILLPNPHPSHLAPEVSAGLPTFGARMPASPLARTLIHLVGAPLAAPSANASTRPSPTTARHVADDLAGRIALVLDGGACTVGVESTVVDGLCDPPAVLRPGGVSLAELRECAGWEGVQKAYRDVAEMAGAKEAPRAPGMKYKHYSPRAKVILYEAPGFAKGGVRSTPSLEDVSREIHLLDGKDPAQRHVETVAFIRTATWPAAGTLVGVALQKSAQGLVQAAGSEDGVLTTGDLEVYEGELRNRPESGRASSTRILDIHIGSDITQIAQLLFAALRELDRLGADIIFVEGVPDADDIAAAVMNRLRKAATEFRR